MADTAQPTGQENTNTGSTGGDQATESTVIGGSTVTAETGKSDAGTATDAATDGKSEGGDTEGKKDDSKQEQVVPEKYELKVPEGFEVDDALLGEFEPLAKELKLTNDGAQKLVETMMPKVVNRLMEQNQKAWASTLESWVGQIKSDKEIGGENLKGSTEAAERALAKFGTPELSALLGYRTDKNQAGLGLGNHPELVRVFARIGKAMAEDTFHNASTAASGAKDPAEVMFGGKS